jgi:hypothetical protein
VGIGGCRMKMLDADYLLFLVYSVAGNEVKGTKIAKRGKALKHSLKLQKC